jgi:DNA helicase-2/ATP-dependent DNA helicase PcrA
VHGKYLRLQTAGTKPAVVAEAGDFETDSNAFQVGMQVEHSRFGKGKILQIEQDKAMIFFPAVGNKQLLLKFAKLKIIG